MSEFLTTLPIDTDAYQQFVASTRTDGTEDDWKDRSAAYLNGESLEVITQHGGAEGVVLFMPSEWIEGFQPTDVSAETRYAIADELGDSLWFTVDALDRVDSSVGAACKEALESFGIEAPDQLKTFNDVQRLVMDNADRIRYIDKGGLAMGHTDVDTAPEHFVTTPPQNPLLYFTRTNRALTRALEDGKKDMAPYSSGADFEPVSDIPLAAGRHILSIAWIAEARLGVTLGGITTFNRDKLLHRAKNGKENDIHFGKSYAEL